MSLLTLFLCLVYIATTDSCIRPNSHNLTYYVVSDTNTWVIGPDTKTLSKASPVFVHSIWTKDIPDATWIWDADRITHPDIDQTCYFMKEFYIEGLSTSAILELAADNSVSTLINGADANCSASDGIWSSKLYCNILPFIVAGINIIQIKVVNYGMANCEDYTKNPGGVVFRISIKLEICY